MTGTLNSTRLNNFWNFMFRWDSITIMFLIFGIIVFLMSLIYSFEYMKEDKNKKRFYVFYGLTFCAYSLLCFAGNLITYYFFFEFLTLLSFPLVLHEGTKEAKLAGLKYLFYSLTGAYMALFALYFSSMDVPFKSGGSMAEYNITGLAATHPTLFLLCSLFFIFGFGVKAGMFPMHAWLPSAHPVAPSPASAILSAAIVKMGVLGIIRCIFYLYGTTYIRGTIVQTIWMTVTPITVFMGSMLAYREDNLKRRLAYSTVSQVSYILFGLSTMNEESYRGALFHVLAHGFAKCGLFLCAGAIIHKTGKTKVSELKGIGKEMPVTMGCFTVFALSLIGIPPTAGFVSKWYLAIGSLKSGVPVFDILGPAVLLISALLTAGYLIVPVIKGFFPGLDYDDPPTPAKDPGLCMKLPMIILAILSVVLGLFPMFLS